MLDASGLSAAAVAGLRPFFQARSVAVVGASRAPEGVGHRVLDALLAAGYRGVIYPVNPKADRIAGLTCFPSVADLPEAPELAVIVVPPAAVPGVVDQCAARGVMALVVITAGFAEIGPDGKARQDRLLAQVRRHGMRMVGPNCLGVLCTDPAVRLNASFAPVYPPAGPVALASESGALGIAILVLAQERQLGLSAFVSLGNRADISSNDLLEYWGEDERTGVILLYLESFGNARRFGELARRVGRRKPIVAVKSGRSPAGQRAAGSHTAALAADDVAAEALFHQCGVIRAATLNELFHLAAALSYQPPIAGRRVGVVTNAGGPGILCADACQAEGLQVPPLSETTRATLRAVLPPTASLANPVDMIAGAGAAEYRQAVAAVLADESIDALVVIHIPIGIADLAAVHQAILEGVATARAAGATAKPVLACRMAGVGECAPAPLVGEQETLPAYAFPEAPAVVLGRLATHAEWLARPPGTVPELDDVRPAKARAVIAAALAARGPGWLTAAETRAVLIAFGLPVAPGGVATTADEAAALAGAIGFPVALKLASQRVVHKTELGGVQLDLPDEAAVRQAFERIRTQLEGAGLGAAMEGVLVQPMIRDGVEVMVGLTADRVFGPLVAFGLGGIFVEILGDVCFRVTPLTDLDAQEMVRSIRGHRLLAGYRGHPAADIAAIETVLLRVSRLGRELPEVSELDLNPVFARLDGCCIADARIRLDPAAARPPG